MATVTRLCYRLLAGNNHIDLSKGLMVHNRSKDYHQKMIYTVVGGMVVDNDNNKIEVQTAPNTWYVKSAVNRGFKKWKEYRSKMLEDTGLKPSEYADFKVYLNSAGSGTYRTPIAASRDPLAVQEWSFSHVENDAGQVRSFQIIGNHTSSRYALLKGWVQNMEKYLTHGPTYPDMDSDNAGTVGPDGTQDYVPDYLNTLHGTNDNISDQVVDVVEENDSVPYVLEHPYSDVNNPDNLQVQCLTYTSANNPSQMLPGFEAICGLINVKADVGTGETGPLLFIDVLSSGRKF